jgi:parvulin-like peptidyl-prolyl isomerase
MSRRAVLALAVAAGAGSLPAQMIDRSVAIVDDGSITESEVLSQLRLEALANAAEVVDSAEERERVLDRLIDQRLIASDIRLTGLPPMSSLERANLLAQLRMQSFGDMSFEAALQEYGVTEAQALEFFARQVEFGRYVEFRFRTGQTVSDEELQQAYRSKYGRTPSRDAPPLELAATQLRNEISNARVERLLEQHVRQLRADHRVVRLERIDRSALTQPGGAP